MPDKNEKEKRKAIARELKLRARQEFENSLPMTYENFKNLFEYLDGQLFDNGCDHSHKLTISFLQSLPQLNFDTIIEWLDENGGYCDCEVLANIKDKFDENAIL